MSTFMPMPALVAWTVCTPFVVMVGVASSPALKRGFERWYWQAVAVGWTGFALVAVGGLVVGGNAGTLAVAVGAPLLGLCVWVRRESEDEGEAPDAEPDLDGPPDGIDWDRFMRDLDDWASRHPSRPPEGVC